MSMRPKLKILELYQTLFLNRELLDEAFWHQFFLLSPQKDAFERWLVKSAQDDLFTSGKVSLRLLFKTSVTVASECFIRQQRDVKGKAKATGNGDLNDTKEQDDRSLRLRCTNAMRTIVLILSSLNKRSLRDGEVVELITDLDEAENLFESLVALVNSHLVHVDTERQHQAVRFCASVIASSPQSTIAAKFMNHELFDQLVGMVETPFAYEAMLCLALLCHHQRFEKQNIHMTMLAGMTRVKTLDTWIGIFGKAFERGISAYKEAWTRDEGKSAHSIIGWLERLAVEDNAVQFDYLPLEECAIALSLYDLAYCNRKSAIRFLLQGFPDSVGGTKSFFPRALPPLTAFLTHSSFLFATIQNDRARYYSRLALIILLCLVEDADCAKVLVQVESSVELCKQRAPSPPLGKTKVKPLLCFIIDLVTCYLNLNLKRRLDVDAYLHCATILHRILVHLKSTSTRLIYHWSYLFATLTTCSRFLVAEQNQKSLQAIPGYHALVRSIITLYNLAVSYGDAFLPDAKSLDDLFYECLRNGSLMDKLGEIGGISIRSGHLASAIFPNPPGSAASSTGSTDTTNLRMVFHHFNTRISQYREAKSKAAWIDFSRLWSKPKEEATKGTILVKDDPGLDLTDLQPEEVLKVIQTSYENLELKEVKGLDTARQYLGGELHEAAFFKTLLRFVISDVHALIPDIVPGI